MILAAPLIPPFAQAVGITAGSLGLIGLAEKVNNYIRANPKESMEILKTISPGTAGIISLFENKKRGIGDNNPPSPIEKEKPPKKEPPKNEEPNLLSEIVTTKFLKEINDSDDTMEDIIPKDYEGPTSKTLESLSGDSFPFSTKDFKEGALDNEIIKNAFLKINSDGGIAKGEPIKGKDEEGEYELFSPIKDEAKFLTTSSRGQQEIMLRFLKDQLIEDKAGDKIIEHITNLQNELSGRIKESGYYGAGSEKEKNLKNLPGYTNNLINKRKLNAKGGLIDKPLLGRSRDIY